jgi:hypothetical protein
LNSLGVAISEDALKAQSWKALSPAKTGCKGRSIPMQKLDDLVTEHLSERLFHPERLTAILASVVAGRTEKALEVDRRVCETCNMLRVRRAARLRPRGSPQLKRARGDRLSAQETDVIAARQTDLCRHRKSPFL